MGLFDIFRKKEKPADSTSSSTSASGSTLSSESLANSTQSKSESSSLKPQPDGSLTLKRPLTEKTGLVNESEADVWQQALQKSEVEPEQDQHSESQSRSQSESSSRRQSETVLSESASTSSSQSESESQNQADASQEEDSDQAAYDQGLEKSRSGFADRLNRFLANFRTVDEEFFENLEDTLISSDVGFDLALRISNELREEVRLKNAKKPSDIRQVIIEKMVDLYEADGVDEDISMHWAPEGQPTVFLFVGVNGVGKTTTIGKMAERYRKEGKKVLLAAADTFRAGATQQLQEWGSRTQVPVVAGPEKADPASVVYEAVEKAKNENYDLLMVDTAGRLQNNVNLMQELAKMKRVIQRVLPEAPQEVLLVLDATTGQNALQQAKLFKDSTDVTGIVLTKMDGTAKGGIIFAIRSAMHLPVKWIGLGEKASDLRVFKPEEFVYGLFKDLVD